MALLEKRLCTMMMMKLRWRREYVSKNWVIPKERCSRSKQRTESIGVDLGLLLSVSLHRTGLWHRA